MLAYSWDLVSGPTSPALLLCHPMQLRVGGRQERSPLALAPSIISTFCNEQQPLVSPMLLWQRPAAPRAVQAVGMLLSAGWACPWLCDPNNKQQQVEPGVAQFCLVPVRAHDETQCNCLLTKGRLCKGSISTDNLL